MKRSGIVRRWIKFVGALAAIACLTGMALLVFFQTPAGKKALASWLSARIGAVRIGKIQGRLPDRFSVDRIELLDDRGPWLTLEHVTVEASPLDLWKGRISIHALRCHSLRMARAPVREITGTPKQDGFAFALPRRLPSIVLDQFIVEQGTLNHVALDEAVSFNAQGRMALSRSDGLTVELAVRETGKGVARIELRGALRPPSWVALDLRVKEEAGGTFARHLRLPPAGALAFRLTGQGALDAWGGETSLRVDQLGAGEIRFRIEQWQPLAFVADMVVRDATIGEQHVSIPNLRVNIRNAIEAPEGSLSGHVLWRDYDVTLKSDFLWKDARLALKGLGLDQAGNTVTGDVRWISSEQLTDGRLRIELRDFDVLNSLADLSLTGSVSADVGLYHADGQQNAAIAGEGSHITYRDVGVGQIRGSAALSNLTDAVHGHFDLTARDVLYSNMVARHMTAVGRGDKRHVEAEAGVEGIWNHEFAAKMKGHYTHLANRHELALDAFHGNFGTLRGHLDAPAVVAVSGNRVELDSLKLRTDSGALEASGFHSPGEVRAAISLNDFPLAMLSMTGWSNLHGSASGHLAVRGRPEQPELDLDVRLADVDLFEVAGIRLDRVTLDAQARLRGSRLSSTFQLTGISETPFRATLDAPMILSFAPISLEFPKDGELKGELSAAVNIEDLTPRMVVKDQVVTGRLEAALSVGGTVTQPSIGGRVSLAGGSYEHLVLGTVLQEVEVEIAGDASRLVITQARATDGRNGFLTLSGSLNLAPEDASPLALELRLRNAAVLGNDNASASVDGVLALKGTFKDMTLSGTLDVTQAEFNIPKHLPLDIVSLDVIEINKPDLSGAAPVERRLAPPGRILTDVRVRLPGRGFVRGRGLESEWRGDMKVSGPLAEPLLSGRFMVVRGYFLFLGRRFTLGRSALSLDGRLPQAAQLDVIAQARAAGITARLSITGSAAAPTLTLDSQPALPQEEILSRLLFGRSADRITPFQAISLAHGLNVLRGGGHAVDILGRGQSLLRVDQLSIQQDEGTAGVAAITAGKYIGDRVYVRGQKSVGSQGDALVLELELSPSLTLETEASPGIREGVNLIWSRDY
jgi:autotransporter translocation and assembly factor TamB